MPNVIRFEGVEGESKITGYEKWIDIGPYSLSGSSAHSGLRGGGLSGGAMQISPITISKKLDSASTKLMNRMSKGEHFDKVEIVSLKTTGTKLDKYLTVELGQVLLAGYSWNNDGEGAHDYPTESWTLSFKKFEFLYLPQTETGTLGEEGVFAIDLEKYEIT
ncbi:Hcp family type VI secretion system effector [Arvimicrobium flavum]|uniref:Hcp family type VI secretion system effector n=1 Tax=Arvimicrobium flavum TaxID=3393320 RepID=UPI00237BDB57|nr:type VI secretion system tube protein Hcp [Mesorhizobium shangrilense]